MKVETSRKRWAKVAVAFSLLLFMGAAFHAFSVSPPINAFIYGGNNEPAQHIVARQQAHPNAFINVTSVQAVSSASSSRPVRAPSRNSLNTCSHHTSLWQQRFRDNPSPGRKYLFFKHIRKAGGTFMRNYLDEVRRYHPDAADPALNSRNVSKKVDLSADPALVSFYEQEFGAHDWRCADRDPRWNDTLSLTVLREPIARYVSEFFYSGVPSLVRKRTDSKDLPPRKLRKLYQNGTYTEDFYALVDEIVPLWMDRVRSRDGTLGRNFVDEFQVRAFSESLDKAAYAEGNKMNMPCAQGKRQRKIFGGGVPAEGEVDEDRLRRAMAALSRYDVVLLTNTMGEQAQMVGDIMGVPLDIASLGREKNDADASDRVMNTENGTRLLEGIARNAPRAHGLLRNATRFEMRLYDYALHLNQELVNRWARR